MPWHHDPVALLRYRVSHLCVGESVAVPNALGGGTVTRTQWRYAYQGERRYFDVRFSYGGRYTFAAALTSLINQLQESA